MSTEVIVLHVGQGGVQLGNAFWELICIEHGITPDGYCVGECEDFSLKAFYQEVNYGRYIPRVIFLDPDPTVIDDVRTGVYRELYHPCQLISDKEDAANNFARGSFLLGNKLLKRFKSMFSKLMEQVDNPESVILFNSFGGGSGSGIGSLLLEQIVLDLPKLCKFQVPIHPSPTMSTAVVEPYNSVFHVHTSLESVDLSLIFDNEALYGICQSLLYITSPTYYNLNKLLSLVLSAVTCSTRFKGSLHTGIREMVTNLIPYPRIHYPFVNHAPIHHPSSSRYSNDSVDQITKDVFSKTHQTAKLDINRGKYIAIMLTYSGMVSPNEIANAVMKYRNTNVHFVEWSPTGFKMGINNQVPAFIPDSDIGYSDKSVTMIANSTSVSEAWLRMSRKFDLLFEKRAFVHWYISEGLEESEFGDAVISVQLLSEDYQEIQMNEEELLEMLNNDPGRRSRSLSMKMNPAPDDDGNLGGDGYDGGDGEDYDDIDMVK